MKITFGIIVFNSDFFLKQCIENVYPYAHQILIAEGPVSWWQSQGHTTSTDRTNEILNNFPDPDKKITIVHWKYAEKHEQCNAYMKHLKPDTDYIWNLDADEFYTHEHIEKIIKLLEIEKYTSVAFRSMTFFGGFSNYLTGFEQNASFLRIQKVYPGSVWKSHRPPLVQHQASNILPDKPLDMITLWNKGIFMYHYSYVMPRQVKEKVSYYKAAVSQDNCIDDYFENVWLKWVNGGIEVRKAIEFAYQGVHEFKPLYRGECRTAPFTDNHHPLIVRDRHKLNAEFDRQLKEYTDNG